MEQGNNPTSEYMAETKSISEYMAETKSTSEYMAETKSTSEYMAETKSTNGVCGQGQPTPVTSTPQDKTKNTDLVRLGRFREGLGRGSRQYRRF